MSFVGGLTLNTTPAHAGEVAVVAASRHTRCQTVAAPPVHAREPQRPPPTARLALVHFPLAADTPQPHAQDIGCARDELDWIAGTPSEARRSWRRRQEARRSRRRRAVEIRKGAATNRPRSAARQDLRRVGVRSDGREGQATTQVRPLPNSL